MWTDHGEIIGGTDIAFGMPVSAGGMISSPKNGGALACWARTLRCTMGRSRSRNFSKGRTGVTTQDGKSVCRMSTLKKAITHSKSMGMPSTLHNRRMPALLGLAGKTVALMVSKRPTKSEDARVVLSNQCVVRHGRDFISGSKRPAYPDRRGLGIPEFDY